jgi:cytoskeletal protein CcmA (bactofilin family)
MALFGRKDPTRQPAADAASDRPGTGTGETRPRLPAPSGPSSHPASGAEPGVARIGESVRFDGKLSGGEDLLIDGQVKGDIKLASHTLTVGPQGRVTAKIKARRVRVLGEVKGNISATEAIEIEATGKVEGDISAPSLLIREGAVINGAIDMGGLQPPTTDTKPSKPAKPARTPKNAKAATKPEPTAQGTSEKSPEPPIQPELAQPKPAPEQTPEPNKPPSNPKPTSHASPPSDESS